jgi:hypothetical protein
LTACPLPWSRPPPPSFAALRLASMTRPAQSLKVGPVNEPVPVTHGAHYVIDVLCWHGKTATSTLPTAGFFVEYLYP